MKKLNITTQKIEMVINLFLTETSFFSIIINMSLPTRRMGNPSLTCQYSDLSARQGFSNFYRSAALVEFEKLFEKPHKKIIIKLAGFYI